jgi:hypothetical protein
MKHLRMALGLVVMTGLMALAASPAMALSPRWVTCVKKASSAFKNSLCTEAGAGEWATQEINETVEVTASVSSLELEDTKATGGATAIKCAGSGQGTAGKEGQDSVTKIKLNHCTFVKAGSCETAVEPSVTAVNLPWSTRLEERENTSTKKLELRDLIRSLTTKPPGWNVECRIAGIFKVADTCEGGTSTSLRSNRATGATEAEFDGVSAQEPATCSVGGSGAGVVRGPIVSKLRTSTGELRPLWVLASTLASCGNTGCLPPAPRIEWVNFTNNGNVILDHRKTVTHGEIETKYKKGEALETAMAIEEYEGTPGEAKDSVEWKSPKASEVTKDWPVVYPQGATMELATRVAVEAGTKKYLEESAAEGPLITGETTVGSTAISFQKSMSLTEVKTQLGEHATYIETPVMLTSAVLPKEVSHENISIKWKWKLKEKGATESFEQALGTSTHNLYKTYAKAPANTKIYFTLLAIETENIEDETKTPSEAQAIKGIWKGFSAKEPEGEEEVLTTRIRAYNPASGVITIGERLWYYQELNTVGKNLKEYRPIDGEPALSDGRQTVPTLLEALVGECGSWQKSLAKSLRAEGITTYENKKIVVKFNKVGPCETAAVCQMLVKNWEFEAPEKAGFTYKETQVKDLKGLAGQGVANPSSFFNNHLIVKIGAGEELYDPSYGAMFKTKLEFQEKSIAGFCVEMVEGEEKYKCSKPPAELALEFKEEGEET